jgi:hypothetical protein
MSKKICLSDVIDFKKMFEEIKNELIVIDKEIRYNSLPKKTNTKKSMRK